MSKLMIGWTTAPDEQTAKSLADGLVNSRLVACVQVMGPIMSHYIWQDHQEISQEYRLSVKFIDSNAEKVSQWLTANHPYDTPEWAAILVDSTSANYLAWAEKVAPHTNRPAT